MADENQPSEVPVFGKQDTVIRMGKPDDVAVVLEGHDFADCSNIETCFAQSSNNREVTSFIRQKSERRRNHEAGCKIIFSCESVSAA